MTNWWVLQKELCSKLGIDYIIVYAGTHDLFNITEIDRLLNMGKDEAVARHSWPFTEKKETDTTVANQEEYDYPAGIKSDSISYLKIDGKRYRKLRFDDYLTYREDYSSGEDKLFSDLGRIIHINPNAFESGKTIDIYGQLIVGDVSSTASTTPFSAAEPEGDEVIVKLAFSKALGSEKMKKPAKARKERLEAFEDLEGIWDRIQKKQHTYKTKDRPLFKRLDVLGGGFGDESETQF